MQSFYRAGRLPGPCLSKDGRAPYPPKVHRRAQADALEIEAGAKRRLADEAQHCGGDDHGTTCFWGYRATRLI